LDTSSFIQGFNSSNPEIKLYTTFHVKDEVRDKMARIRLENWERSGRIIIKSPRRESLQRVLLSSKKLGEQKALSDTDHSIIALALELSIEYDTTIISDDYSVQNLSNELGIKHQGLATKGIKKRFQWLHYCPGCRKQYSGPQENNVCSICGTELKRKPGKKSSKRRV
jgi:UPF0271 protein